ncbi:MAG: tripartite tricarboxylate transporter TctB family protein [Thermodesulfobacteriota bacterium]
MRLVYLFIGLAFLAMSVYVMVGAFALEYYTPIGPGPGFFPFWLAAILAVLTAVWLVRVYMGPREPLPEGFFPSRSAGVQIISVLGALILFVFLAELLGFRITMLGFLLFVLYGPGRQSAPISITIAIAGSFGAYYLFHDLLGIHLPFATIGFLENLGL